MSDVLAVAIIGGMVSIATAIIVPILVRLLRRITHLERQNRLAWIYTRRLIDHAYRYSDTNAHPLPAPPVGWLDDDES